MASGSNDMDWEETKASLGSKRTLEVDPDSGEQLQDSKRQKVMLDASKKVLCLKLILEGYVAILHHYFPIEEGPNKHRQETEQKVAHSTVQVSIQIANIIFTLHTYKRQMAAGKTTANVVKKSANTDFTITYLGSSISKTRDELVAIWDVVCTRLKLTYKVFSRSEDDANWYGTFGPYIDFFCGFGLRMKELRLGYDRMPISKKDDVMIEVPVRKYGLNGAHHILLEGSTFPPEKRSSMAQSVGPMTAMLSMVRSEGIYRLKWAAAVKRAFNHIPVIDDIIEITKTHKKAVDISTIIGLLAEITLITTSKQTTRAFFPLAFFYEAWRSFKTEEDQIHFLNFFNTTGSGAFLTYKLACKIQWFMIGGMTEETAGQVVFHSIFGTYKEDLGVLEDITDVGSWKTREEMGKCFIKTGKETNLVRVKLPKYKYYSKLSCANMSGLLSGVYNQVCAIPVYSGVSMRMYGDDFFEHIDKKMIAGSTGKSISQITSSLSITLDELRKQLKDKRGLMQMRTTMWRNMSDLDVNSPGSEANVVVQGKGKYFMGKSAK